MSGRPMHIHAFITGSTYKYKKSSLWQNTNLLGKAGEDAAVDYLERHDYVIRHRNWRKGHFELDIVAAKKRRTDYCRSKKPEAIRTSHFLKTPSLHKKIRRNCNSSRYIYQVIPK